MKPTRRSFVIAGSLAATTALVLSACASNPPMNFYTLTPIAPTATVSGVKPIRLQRLTIPRELDRPQLLRRVDATQLSLAEQDRWAAPLEDLVRRTLTEDLAARAPGLLAPSPEGMPLRTVNVDLQEFVADAACNVTLRATWTVTQPSAPLSQGNANITESASGACETRALPAAMSRALAQLSDQLVTALSR